MKIPKRTVSFAYQAIRSPVNSPHPESEFHTYPIFFEFVRLKEAHLSYYGENKPPPDRLVLTRAEEDALFASYSKRRTAKTREKLVRAYLCMAFNIASKLKGPRLSHDEAIGAANLGLMEALDNFNAALGYRFATYAYFVIRRHVIEALVGSYPVQISSHIRKKLRKEEKSGELIAVEGRIGDPQTLGEVFDRLGQHTEWDFDAASFRGEDITTISCTPEDPAELNETSSTIDEIRDFISGPSLSDLERKTINLRHYVDPPLSFKDIARKCRVRKKPVQVAYESAVNKLRTHFNTDAISETT